MYGLLGPNGAGKTTLMRILAGILRPTTGKAFVDGHDLSTTEGRRAVKEMLGYLPQEFGACSAPHCCRGRTEPGRWLHVADAGAPGGAGTECTPHER